MALKATKLIRLAQLQPATPAGLHKAKELLIQARELARARHQSRTESMARHVLARLSTGIPTPAPSPARAHREGCGCVICRQRAKA